MMYTQQKRDLIRTLRLRTTELEKALAQNDLDQVKALEHLLDANMGFLSDLIDLMGRDW